MSVPSLQHLFERTAAVFAVTPAQMRAVRDTALAHDARLAFCRLASRAGYGALPIAFKIALDVKWVDAAVWEAGGLFDRDRAFAERCVEIELECAAENGVAKATAFPLPADYDACAIAHVILDGPRAAMGVGVAQLQTQAAAYLALARAPSNSLSKEPENGQEAEDAA